MTTTITLDPALLFENGKTAALVSPGGGLDYYNVGNGASWRWHTTSRYMEVDCYVTAAFNIVSCPERLGVRVRIGSAVSDFWYTVPLATGGYTAQFWLPAGNKTVELHVPAQFATASGGAPTGVYPRVVRFDRSASAISPSLLATHAVIYGDSIASGGVGVSPVLLGYTGLMRRGVAAGGYGGSVTQVCWGYRRLADDCNTSQKRIDFAAFLLALAPTKIILAIGSNDQATVPATTLANFTTYYTGLLDQIIAQHATMPIVCTSPIIRTDESANSNGETMAQFRSAISTAAAARPTRCTYVDGLAICILGDLPDSIHPGTTANASKMLPAFLAAAA